MALEILLVKEGTRLGAHDPIAAEDLESIKPGEVVKCVITRPRNVRHLRKWFAFMRAVFDAQDRYPTMDGLLDGIKVGVGHYDLVTLPGKIPIQILKPRSISFGSMAQNGFEQWYDRAVEHVLAEIIPGLDRADLEARVLEILDGRNA